MDKLQELENRFETLELAIAAALSELAIRIDNMIDNIEQDRDIETDQINNELKALKASAQKRADDAKHL